MVPAQSRGALVALSSLPWAGSYCRGEAMQIILSHKVSPAEPWQGALAAGWPMESGISGECPLLSMVNPLWAACSILQPCQGHLDPWAAESPVTAPTVPATVLVIFPAVVPACHGLFSAGHNQREVGWNIPRDSHVSWGPKGTASQREFPVVPSPVLRAGWWQWYPSVGTRAQAGHGGGWGEAGLCPQVPVRRTHRDWGSRNGIGGHGTGWGE